MKKIIIYIVIVVLAIFVGCTVYFLMNKGGTVEFLEKNGYIKDKVEVGNYSKVLTNNTFDEYYDKTDAGFTDEYKEYTISPESENFIYRYLFSKDTVINNSLIIIYNFRDEKTSYEYIITNNNDNSRLVLTGKYRDKSLTCNLDDDRRISETLLNNYCNTVKEELIKFIDERNVLTSNKNFMDDILGE